MSEPPVSYLVRWHKDQFSLHTLAINNPKWNIFKSLIIASKKVQDLCIKTLQKLLKGITEDPNRWHHIL